MSDGISGGAPMFGGQFDKDIMFCEDVFPFPSDHKHERQAFALRGVTYVSVDLIGLDEADLHQRTLAEGLAMRSFSGLSPDANYVPFEWARENTPAHPASNADWADYHELLARFNFPLAPVE